MTKLGEERIDYHEQVEHNEFAFKELVKQVRPDIWMLMDLLDETETNYLILVKVLRHLNNIATGTKFGTVSVDIQDGIATFVKGLESDRLNEPVIAPRKRE